MFSPMEPLFQTISTVVTTISATAIKISISSIYIIRITTLLSRLSSRQIFSHSSGVRTIRLRHITIRCGRMARDAKKEKCAVSDRRSTSISARNSTATRNSPSMCSVHIIITPRTTTTNSGPPLRSKNPPPRGRGALLCSSTTTCAPRTTSYLSLANLPIPSHGALPASRLVIRQHLPSPTIRYAICYPTTMSMLIPRTTTTTIFTVKSAENSKNYHIVSVWEEHTSTPITTSPTTPSFTSHQSSCWHIL